MYVNLERNRSNMHPGSYLFIIFGYLCIAQAARPFYRVMPVLRTQRLHPYKFYFVRTMMTTWLEYRVIVIASPHPTR